MDMFHHFRDGFQGHIAGQANPAPFETTPYIIANLLGFQNFHTVTIDQLTHAGVVGAGTTADIQIRIFCQSGVSLLDSFRDIIRLPLQEMVAMLAFLAFQTLMGGGGQNHGVPIAHAVAGGLQHLGFVVAAGAITAAQAVFGTGSGFCRVPGTKAVTGGIDHLSLVMAASAIMPAQAVFGAGNCLNSVPCAKAVAGGIDHLGLVVAAFAVPTLLTVFGASSILHSVPIAKVMDMGHHFLHFFQGSVAADTNPALFDAAPYSAIDIHLFKYFRHIALVQGGHPTIAGAGATAHIQAGAGDGSIDPIQDLAIEGLLPGLRISTNLAVPAFLTGDFVSGFYADIPITINVILLCQGFGFIMIAVFAILPLQAFCRTGGIGLGVPTLHAVAGGRFGLELLLTAMDANLHLNMIRGAVAHLGYLPIAIRMANGR